MRIIGGERVTVVGPVVRVRVCVGWFVCSCGVCGVCGCVGVWGVWGVWVCGCVCVCVCVCVFVCVCVGTPRNASGQVAAGSQDRLSNHYPISAGLEISFRTKAPSCSHFHHGDFVCGENHSSFADSARRALTPHCFYVVSASKFGEFFWSRATKVRSHNAASRSPRSLSPASNLQYQGSLTCEHVSEIACFLGPSARCCSSWATCKQGALHFPFQRTCFGTLAFAQKPVNFCTLPRGRSHNRP